MRGECTWICVAAMSWALLGCDPDEGGSGAEPDELATPRLFHDNGVRLNGVRLNGVRLNGVRLNGVRLNGDVGTTDYVEVLDFELPDWSSAVDSWLVGSNLHVETDYGWELTDWDLEDSIVHVAVKEEGVLKQRELWIKSVVQIGTSSDVFAYDIDIRDAGGPWKPLCTDELGAATRAILLGDVWDPDTGARVAPRPSGALTFACRTAALAKCVEFGYAPWRSKNGVQLAEHHQACTRMLRADYCGTGQAHTVAGVPVHVLDPLGIQKADPTKAYAVEAEWGPNGATCLNPGNTRLAGQTAGCSLPACGSAFASGGLIQSGKLAP